MSPVIQSRMFPAIAMQLLYLLPALFRLTTLALTDSHISINNAMSGGFQLCVNHLICI
ncbi:hypothetical protein [Xanthocytophaga agilis]|uniref:Uncharacterized protein n=1 Tax=Xanthocytophaga agilis TaxID=3048010 RepID=A0AAE3R204_9BACT|nr:hypothetical protein [Xanthocytophaga agilis]MDJ1501620.1 hypothetical protein [Xanthocytophaga agilis]